MYCRTEACVNCVARQTLSVLWTVFEPYLPVSRLESDISRIIAKIAISCTLDFPTIKFQIFCVVSATAGTLTFKQ